VVDAACVGCWRWQRPPRFEIDTMTRQHFPKRQATQKETVREELRFDFIRSSALPSAGKTDFLRITMPGYGSIQFTDYYLGRF